MTRQDFILKLKDVEDLLDSIHELADDKFMALDQDKNEKLSMYYEEDVNTAGRISDHIGGLLEFLNGEDRFNMKWLAKEFDKGFKLLLTDTAKRPK